MKCDNTSLFEIIFHKCNHNHNQPNKLPCLKTVCHVQPVLLVVYPSGAAIPVTIAPFPLVCTINIKYLSVYFI